MLGRTIVGHWKNIELSVLYKEIAESIFPKILHNIWCRWWYPIHSQFFSVSLQALPYLKIYQTSIPVHSFFLFLFKVDSQEAEVLGICNGGVDLNIQRLCKKSERKEALGVLLDLSSLI